MRLYFSDDRPETGWTISRQDDGTFLAEQIGGPRSLTASTLPGLISALANDATALDRKFTETQIRQAATTSGCNPDTIATALRSMA